MACCIVLYMHFGIIAFYIVAFSHIDIYEIWYKKRTAIETVLQAGLNYLFRHKMISLPGQPIKTALASSFNA